MQEEKSNIECLEKANVDSNHVTDVHPEQDWTSEEEESIV